MRRRIYIPFAFLLIFISEISYSQDYSFNYDRLIFAEFQYINDSSFHLTIKPFSKNEAVLNNYDSLKFKNSFLKHLFNNNLFIVHRKKANIVINPIIQYTNTVSLNSSEFYSDKRIGFRLSTAIKNKLNFSGNLFYVHANLPEFQIYSTDSFQILYHYGYLNPITSNNFSFVSFTGELSYHPSDFISFHIGNGKHFFGNGYRSLFLSDNSSSYPYFKTTADVWKIKYIWLIAKLKDFELLTNELSDTLYNKAVFLHYLSVNLTKRFNFNFFEAIISNPYDETGNKNAYEAAYFNPVIFYRPVEFYSGTSDNSLMGVGINLRIFKSAFIYSQFLLDDLVISSLKDGSGWWGNKFGLQLGIKTYNTLNIKDLFFRQEFNLIRPYTYSHGYSVSENSVSNLNYGHYHQNLAHPSGANIAEAISQLLYYKGRFSAALKFTFSEKGIDTDSVSYGGDTYKAYNLRPADYGIKFLQGNVSIHKSFDLKFSYIINPNYHLAVNTGVFYRSISDTSEKPKNLFIYFGLSTNVFNDYSDFQH
jgi:hypothetical protein